MYVLIECLWFPSSIAGDFHDGGGGNDGNGGVGGNDGNVGRGGNDGNDGECGNDGVMVVEV